MLSYICGICGVESFNFDLHFKINTCWIHMIVNIDQTIDILSSKNLSNLKFCQLSKDCSDVIYLLSFSSFRIQLEVKVSSREDLHDLEMSETRILLLYSTRQEGSQIMKWAKEAGLTAKSYVWIATQSVIGESFEALPDFPEGMLGKYFFYYRWTPKFDPNYVQIGILCTIHTYPTFEELALTNVNYHQSLPK